MKMMKAVGSLGTTAQRVEWGRVLDSDQPQRDGRNTLRSEDRQPVRSFPMNHKCCHIFFLFAFLLFLLFFSSQDEASCSSQRVSM